MKVRFNHQNGFVLDGRVFCEVYGIAENESNDELLNLGWLPSVEEKNIWYQSRSYRIELSNFVISKKRRYIIKKLNCEVNDYTQDQEIDNFFQEYYDHKSYNLMEYYINGSEFFKPKLLCLKLDGKLVAVGRYTENETSNVFLDFAYDKNNPKLSLGTNLYYILADITKKQNKDYLYIYESYDDSYL